MSRVDDMKRAREWLKSTELGDGEPYESALLADLIAEVRAETLEEAIKAAKNAPLEWTSPFQCRENTADAIRALKESP